MIKRLRNKIAKRVRIKTDRMMAALISSGGLQRLAAAMAAPLRVSWDYSGISRRLFYEDVLRHGDLPVYDSDMAVDRTSDDPLENGA